MNKVTDDNYLLRLKKVGKDDAFIAAKLGISVEEVRRRWDSLLKMASEKEQNGSNELTQVQLVLVEQFRLLGQSIGVYAAAMHNHPEPSEVRKAIESCPKDLDLAVHLLKHFIILNPFILPSPEKLAEDLENQNISKN